MIRNRLLTGVLGATLLLATWGSAQPAPGFELRVCSDPNNMPYSNKEQEGYENRIAEIIADELGARLTYRWYPQRQSLSREVFREGGCDMVMGVNDGNPFYTTTIAYYQSTYVFVYREDKPFTIDSLDDPDLKRLRLGVPVPVGDGAAVPPTQALINRGLADNLVGFLITGDYSKPHPHKAIVQAVIDGQVDVSVPWGPIGGYYAKTSEVPLEVVPVTPTFEPPFLPMVWPISMGVRLGDEDFRDELNRAIVIRWDEIQAVLEEYNVPLVPLAKPTLESVEPSNGG